MSSLFGANKNVNNTVDTNTTTNTTGQRLANAETRAENIIEERAPIINEQHVYTQAQTAPEIREKHVVREQHLVQEVPVIEKKVIHERPVIQEKTIVHEKPIVHEKKVITNEQQVVREAPLITQAADQVVREQPTIIRDQTNVQHNTLRQDAQIVKNDVKSDVHNLENKESSKPGFFGSLFGGAKNEEQNLKNDAHNAKTDLKNDAHNLEHNNANTNQQSGGMLKNLFSSNVPRPFATTTYDYGTAGSTTVAASVPASDLNTTSTLPQGPIDNSSAFAHNSNKISSA